MDGVTCYSEGNSLEWAMQTQVGQIYQKMLCGQKLTNKEANNLTFMCSVRMLGVVGVGGWQFDFRPFLRLYRVHWADRQETRKMWATSPTAIRKCVQHMYGKPTSIVVL